MSGFEGCGIEHLKLECSMFNFEGSISAERMGYNGTLKALKDPDNPENEELLDWVWENFDAEKFDLERVSGRI